MPTIPPSVPGMRLEGLLVAALRAAGGELVLGPTAVGVEGDARPGDGGAGAPGGPHAGRSPPTRWCSPPAGFASGGIDLDSHGHLRETVAGLPVAGPPAGDPGLAARSSTTSR